MSCYYYTRVWLVVTLEFLFSLRGVSFSQNNLHSEHQLRAPMATLNRTLTSFRLTNGTEAMASTTKICFLLAVMHSILASSSAFLSVSGPQRPQRVRILFIPANSADWDHIIQTESLLTTNSSFLADTEHYSTKLFWWCLSILVGRLGRRWSHEESWRQSFCGQDGGHETIFGVWCCICLPNF